MRARSVSTTTRTVAPMDWSAISADAASWADALKDRLLRCGGHHQNRALPARCPGAPAPVDRP